MDPGFEARLNARLEEVDGIAEARQSTEQARPLVRELKQAASYLIALAQEEPRRSWPGGRWERVLGTGFAEGIEAVTYLAFEPESGGPSWDGRVDVQFETPPYSGQWGVLTAATMHLRLRISEDGLHLAAEEVKWLRLEEAAELGLLRTYARGPDSPELVLPVSVAFSLFLQLIVEFCARATGSETRRGRPAGLARTEQPVKRALEPRAEPRDPEGTSFPLRRHFDDRAWIGFLYWFQLAWEYMSKADDVIQRQESDLLVRLIVPDGDPPLLPPSVHAALGSMPELADEVLRSVPDYGPEVLGPLRAQAQGEQGFIDVQSELMKHAEDALGHWVADGPTDLSRRDRAAWARGIFHEVVHLAVRVAFAAPSPDGERTNAGEIHRLRSLLELFDVSREEAAAILDGVSG